MARMERRSKRGNLVLALLLVFAAFSLVGACGAPADDDSIVSSDEQGDMDSSQKRGIVGKVIAAADNQPIADVIIDVISLDQPSTLIPERIVLSEANGQYYWPLGPGNYELSVKAAGYEPMTGRVQVEEAGPAILDFRLEKIE